VPSPDLADRLADFGALGLIVAGLAWIAVRLWRDLSGSWEDRLEEARKMAVVSVELAKSQTELAEAMRARTEALKDLAECVRAIRHDMQEVRSALDAMEGREPTRRARGGRSDEHSGAGRPP
jgi:hypothetical protein